MREEAINIRHNAQTEVMNKLFEEKSVSPRTYNLKKHELQRWVEQEREELKKTKKEFEKGWLKAIDQIKR